MVNLHLTESWCKMEKPEIEPYLVRQLATDENAYTDTITDLNTVFIGTEIQIIESVSGSSRQRWIEIEEYVI